NRPPEKVFTFVTDQPDKIIVEYFSKLTPFGYRLIEKFWPGPLTIIYYSENNEKIGVRVPAHPVAQAILHEVGKRVFLPSANKSGDPEATSIAQIEADFADAIDIMVDSGAPHYAKSSTVLDLTVRPFKILREGVVSERAIIDVFIKKRILFVCTGNTCRSPMAQLLFKNAIAQDSSYPPYRYEVISRGISALTGSRISSPAVSVLQERKGIDAREFTARRLDHNTLLSADFIFAMEDEQMRYLLDFEPTIEGRLFHLKKFLPLDLEDDIPDPIGRSYETYEYVYGLLQKAILELKDWL
ncbi:MAG: Sua5/YciO/YrdC/YwlC family protein, partial [Candidatus Omnitrophica bacterium]|nr:Sua5/YciO/YrdC/YwlC family protein [Candidatus Omnitrophota bacterium]